MLYKANPISWGVFWPIIQFPGDIFLIYGNLLFGRIFNPKTTFFGPSGPGLTPGWGINRPHAPFPITWGVFWPIIHFPGGLLGWYGSLPLLSILTWKRAFFAAPWPGNGTWRRAKWDTWMVCWCSGRDNNVISSEKSHIADIQFAYSLSSQCPFFSKSGIFSDPLDLGKNDFVGSNEHIPWVSYIKLHLKMSGVNQLQISPPPTKEWGLSFKWICL